MVVDADDGRARPSTPWEPEPLPLVEHLPVAPPRRRDEPREDEPVVIVIDLA